MSKENGFKGMRIFKPKVGKLKVQLCGLQAKEAKHEALCEIAKGMTYSDWELLLQLAEDIAMLKERIRQAEEESGNKELLKQALEYIEEGECPGLNRIDLIVKLVEVIGE